MSHDHCDCVEGLEEHIARLQQQLAEQDARGLRLAGENERLRGAFISTMQRADDVTKFVCRVLSDYPRR